MSEKTLFLVYNVYISPRVYPSDPVKLLVYMVKLAYWSTYIVTSPPVDMTCLHKDLPC